MLDMTAEVGVAKHLDACRAELTAKGDILAEAPSIRRRYRLEREERQVDRVIRGHRDQHQAEPHVRDLDQPRRASAQRATIKRRGGRASLSLLAGVINSHDMLAVVQQPIERVLGKPHVAVDPEHVRRAVLVGLGDQLVPDLGQDRALCRDQPRLLSKGRTGRLKVL